MCRYLVLAVFVVMFAPAAVAGPLELEVDCDAGDSLYEALRSAERVDWARIKIRGFCLGNHFVTSNNVIELIGDPEAATVLQSGSGSGALAGFGPGQLYLYNLQLRGGDGVRASGNLRVISLTNCQVEAQNLGVFSDAGALIALQNSEVAGLQAAVYTVDAGVFAEESILRDSTYGARLFRGQLWLDRCEVTGSKLGILAENYSLVQAQAGRLGNNGQAHLVAQNDSRLSLYNVQIGGPGDTTALSLGLSRGSSVEIFNDDPGVDVWGGANLFDDSFMSLEGTTLHGSIQLRGFSRLRLDGEVDGGVGCQSGADAICEAGARSVFNGCPGAPQVCEPGDPAQDPVTPLPHFAPVAPLALEHDRPTP